MAVTSVSQIHDGHSGTDTKDGSATVTIPYRVITNSVLDGPDVILRASGLPWMGMFYVNGNDVNPLLQVSSRNPSRQSNFVWEVSIGYSTSESGDGKKDEKGKQEDDPGKWHDEIGINGVTFTKAAERALFLPRSPKPNPALNLSATIYTPDVGIQNRAVLPVVNSAGDPFDPPLEAEESRIKISITRYNKNYPANTIRTFMGKVNSDVFVIYRRKLGFSFTAAKHEMKCVGIGASQFYNTTGTGGKKKETSWWKVNYEFLYNPNTWVDWILDVGFRERLKDGDQDQFGNAITAQMVTDLGGGKKFFMRDLKTQVDGEKISTPTALRWGRKETVQGKFYHIPYLIPEEERFRKLHINSNGDKNK